MKDIDDRNMDSYLDMDISRFEFSLEFLKRCFYLSDFEEPKFKDIKHRHNEMFYSAVYMAAYASFPFYFKRKKITGIENLEQIQDSAALLISSHKSHTDYFLIPFHMHEKGLKPPAIVAGDNLFVPFIADIFRRMKALKFKRRGSKEEFNLSIEYMKRLFENKEHILLFPEFKKQEKKAGRSYSGELIDFSSLPCHFNGKDLFFVPLSVAYSKTIEDDLFPRLTTAKSKNKFVLKDIPHILKHPLSYGRVDYQINFGQPELYEKGTSRKKFLKHLHKKTGDLYTVFPSAVFAQALRQLDKTNSGDRVDYKNLINQIKKTEGKLRNRNAYFSDTYSSIDSIIDESEKVFDKRAVFFKSNHVKVYKKQLIDYYANTIEHLMKDG